MQDGHLLHLPGDIALPDSEPGISAGHPDIDPFAIVCTDQCLLTAEDRIALSHLAPDEVQEWCLSRIAEYRNHNRLLRERSGAATRNAISKNKSHIRAIRTAYNDAAPINQHLPPEVLMEVFSLVHPAVVPRSHVPVLRVCRYWRRLLFRTPQFWTNLLSLPTWEAWNPKHHMGRFRAVLERSAPQSLVLSVPYCSQVLVDMLPPHGGRISSSNVGPTLFNVEEIGHPRVKQRLYCVTHRPFLHSEWRRTSALTFDFSPFPNVRSLELQHTYFHTPTALCLSLCHLKLDHCAARPSFTAGDVPAMCAVHNTLESFPNLETLSLTCCLSEEGPVIPGEILSVPGLTKTVHLTRLRHLELKDLSAHISHFASHLVFPSTTSIVLEPSYVGDLAGISTTLSLHLVFQGRYDESEKFVRWETHGAGVPPVRVTLVGATSNVPTISRFTRALVAALAPARGLTALTVVGWGPSSVRRYWDDLWPALGQGLRCLAYEADPGETDTQELIWQREREKTGLGGAFACPVLETLALEWHLPTRLDYGPDGEWRVLRERDDGRYLGHRAVGLLPSFREFCDTIRVCLSARAAWCSPLRELSVTMFPSRFDAKGVVLQGWQITLVEERMHDRLGDLVENIAVVGGVH
ncbi:hypothetical protein V8D89_008774 [Ganoderma adspersum]